jgi:hypothetical protein
MKNLNIAKLVLRSGIAGLASIGALFAEDTGGLSSVTNAMNNICGQLMTILPPLSMLLVVLAAIFYAAGKLVPNPEFSGRASGMAAAAIAAAVICLVIVLIMPGLLEAIYKASGKAVDFNTFCKS